MKKYLPYIAILIVGLILGGSLYRLFAPKPKTEYKGKIKKLEIVEAEKQKEIDSLKDILSEIEKDSVIIYKEHEEIRNKPRTDRLHDSLRAELNRRGSKRFEHNGF